MNEEKNTPLEIVCVGLPTWEGDYAKTIVQILSEFARSHAVLYVDYEHTVKDLFMAITGRKRLPVMRMLGITDRLRRLPLTGGAAVNVLTPPPVLPVNWIRHRCLYRFCMKINAAIVRRSIIAAMKRLGYNAPVVINAFNPFFGVPLAGKLRERLLMYYCYDNIAVAQWAGKHGAALEKEMIELADVVITTSAELNKEKSTLNPNTLLINNGVDYELFADGASGTSHTSERPVIGYIGSIDNRIDYDLLDRVISSMTDFTFRFIGRITSEDYRRRLAAHRNVELLGAMPFADLPAQLQMIDAGMIPFVCDEFTKSIYPLKINEYLAAGKPVVMTPFAQLDEFGALVSVTGTDQQFGAALRAAARDTAPETIALRRKAARGNSWTNKAAELAEIIQTSIGKKSRA